MSNRSFFLLIVFLSVLSQSLAQKIILENANLSSSDRKKSFICIGDSYSGYINLLDDQGIIWQYNGSSLNQWNDIPIENPQFIQQIFISDSILYACTMDALISFKKDDSKAQLIKKSTLPYFTKVEGRTYFVESDRIYKIKQNELKRLSISFPIRKRESIENSEGEQIYFAANQIHWRHPSGSMIANIDLDHFDQFLVDFWGNVWILQNGKLIALEFIRTDKKRGLFKFENEEATLIKSIKEDIYSVHGNNKLVKWKNSKSPVLVVDAKENIISDYWIDNTNRIWILDDRRKLHHRYHGKWFSWNSNDLDIKDDILGFSVEGDIVSIIFENEGIYQSRIKTENEDWIWVPHRLNKRLKNLSFRAFAQRADASNNSNKLHLFSENFGVFILNNKELGLMKDGFPAYGLDKVMVRDQYVILLDKGRRWHKFIFGQAERKSFTPLHSDTLPPEITSEHFLMDGDYILYQSEEDLVTLNSSNSIIATRESTFDLEKTFILEHCIYKANNRTFEVFALPVRPISQAAPRLVSVIMETEEGREVLMTNSNDTLVLMDSDFPITLSVIASYVSNPNAIEYSWKSERASGLNSDFQYHSEVKWKKPIDGTYNLNLILKVDDAQDSHFFTPLEVRSTPVRASNTWAIYLSGILAALLAILFVGFRLNSRNQKRKITRLKNEKRTMELEQKALQLQMNPHFIFNALNGVKGMIALGENKKARQYLTKVSTWIRNMLNDARADKIPLSKELENLSSYLEIEQELQGNKWEYSISVPDNLNRTYLIPPMMIQPFVENAIVHAFKGVQFKGRIELRFMKKGKRIEVEIEDNGIGLNNSSDKNHKSVALELIKDRLKLLNQGTELEGFSLINKAEYVGSGVLVKMLLPILD